MLCNHQVQVWDKRPGHRSGRAWMLVPCGRCIACRLNKGRAWSVRIMHEVKHVSASCFATLTYDDKNLPAHGSLSVKDCQLFMKRLRKNTGKKIRFFLGGEYGEKGQRPHYHVILFGLGREDRAVIELSWGLGIVHVGDVTPDSAAYVAGYTLKKLSGERAGEYALRGVVPEFGLMSRRPGIGECYVSDPVNRDFMRDNGFVTHKGKKVGIPRYYADRVFVSEEEKLKLHEKRQKVIEEGFEKSRLKLGVDSSSLGRYRTNDYQMSERAQGECDLEKRQEMHRRKL